MYHYDIPVDCIINQLSIDNYRKHFKGIEEKYIDDIIDAIKYTLNDASYTPCDLFDAIEESEDISYVIKRRAYKVLKNILTQIRPIKNEKI